MNTLNYFLALLYDGGAVARGCPVPIIYYVKCVGEFAIIQIMLQARYTINHLK